MGRHIAYSVHESPARALDIAQVVHLPCFFQLALKKILRLFLSTRHLVCDGEQGIRQFLKLRRADFDGVELFRLLFELLHVILSKSESLLSFFHLCVDISAVTNCPGALGTFQCHVQRILADDTNGRHAHFQRAESVMPICQAQIGLYDVVQDTSVRHLGEHPNTLTICQASCRLVANIAAYKLVCECERLRILNRLISAADNSENTVIRLTDVELVTRLLAFVQDGNLLHRPIQTSQLESGFGIRSFLNDSSKTVPRHLAHRKHRLNICTHYKFLLNLSLGKPSYHHTPTYFLIQMLEWQFFFILLCLL